MTVLTSNPSDWTERSVICLVANGTLPAATHWHQQHFYLLTTTPGVRWSATRAAFVYRSPDVWLSDHMQQRMIGLPLLIGQPIQGIMNSDEFVARICGFIVYSTVRNDSLIAVARVLSNDAVAIMDKGVSAAPACQFSGDEFRHVNANGTPLLIEPSPTLISHISLIPVGDSTAGISVIQEHENA